MKNIFKKLLASSLAAIMLSVGVAQATYRYAGSESSGGNGFEIITSPTLTDATGNYGYEHLLATITPTANNSFTYYPQAISLVHSSAYDLTNGDLGGMLGLPITIQNDGAGTVMQGVGTFKNFVVGGSSTMTSFISDLIIPAPSAGSTITKGYGTFFVDNSAGGTFANGYVFGFQSEDSDWMTDSSINVFAGGLGTHYIPLSSTSDRFSSIARTMSTDGDAANVFALTAGADLAEAETLHTVKSTITSFASGMTNAAELSAYSAYLVGNASDSDVVMNAFAAWDVTTNGGTQDASAFFVGTGYASALAATSGDLDFEGYSPTFRAEVTMESDTDGHSITIQPSDGYDSGATARAGGDLALKRGAAVNAGTEGSVILDVDNATAGTTKLANGQMYFWLDESGNNLKVQVKYSSGTTKTATIAFD